MHALFAQCEIIIGIFVTAVAAFTAPSPNQYTFYNSLHIRFELTAVLANFTIDMPVLWSSDINTGPATGLGHYLFLESTTAYRAFKSASSYSPAASLS